jgi:hypothetical protein
MAFDFPAGPTVGDVYRPTGGPAWQWDGEKWEGGQPSGPQKDLVVDLTGKSTVDVTVPTWAKSCTIDGVLWPAGTGSYTLAQLSTDGSTFHAGTSYQLVGGIVHNVTGGYTTQGSVAVPGIYLDYPNANLLIAHTFNCHLNLEAAIAGQLLSARSEAQSYGTNGAMQIIWEGYLNVGVAPARVQKLRFNLQGAGVYPINSYLHITWIGNDAQVPISNAVPDAPNDGISYERKNGLWVPTPQQLLEAATLTVAGQPHIQLPAGYKRYKLILRKFEPVLTGSTMCLRYTTDGSTFINAANYMWTNSYFNQSMSANAVFASTGAAPTSPTTLWAIFPGTQTPKSGTNTSIEIDIDPGAAGYFHNVRWVGLYASGATTLVWQGGGRYNQGGSIIKSVVVFYHTGNVDTGGEYELWGYR